MADFQTAYKWMRKGHRVRRELWTIMPRCKDRYICLNNLDTKVNVWLGNDKNFQVTISYEELSAKDWEIFYESDLSSNVKEDTHINSGRYYYGEQDVKDAFIKLRKALDEWGDDAVAEVDKIAGARFKDDR